MITELKNQYPHVEFSLVNGWTEARNETAHYPLGYPEPIKHDGAGICIRGILGGGGTYPINNLTAIHHEAAWQERVFLRKKEQLLGSLR